MNQVEDGTIEISADDPPSFLYETGMVYNPGDETAGLFQGFLLVQVSLHSDIFAFNIIVTSGLPPYLHQAVVCHDSKRAQDK